jgi:hypothetical protein
LAPKPHNPHPDPGLSKPSSAAVCILVWAFSRPEHGDFWPKWVLLGTLIMYVRRVGRRSGKRELPPPSGER